MAHLLWVMVDLMKWYEWHPEEMSELMMVTFNIIFPSPVMEISNTSVTWAGVASWAIM